MNRIKNVENATLTRHAEERMNQRKIPKALIQEALTNGKRVLLPFRQAYQYELKNVLGMRGKTLVVVQAFNGCILTSYLVKGKNRISRS